MKQRTLALLCVCALVGGLFACSSANPAAPVPPAAGGANAASDGSTLKVSAPGVQSPVNDFKFQTPAVTLTASGAALQFPSATPVSLQYRFQIFNAGGTMVVNSLVSGTTFNVTTALAENQRHTWKVRAESGGEAGPFSSTASFITLDPAVISDPLTDGRTVGTRLGGQFIVGQGWQSLSLTDAIEYDVQGGCSDCRIEFDATNFGAKEGEPFEKDLKWLSMGDAPGFASFDAFRDHEWKMHLVQRADFDSGMEIIWRNGGTKPDGDPGDHRIKLTDTPITFRTSSVYHFQLDWGPSGYRIFVNGIEVMSDGWGRPYNPPRMRIQLGCVPRVESFVGIIYRNFKLTKH